MVYLLEILLLMSGVKYSIDELDHFHDLLRIDWRVLSKIDMLFIFFVKDFALFRDKRDHLDPTLSEYYPS